MRFTVVTPTFNRAYCLNRVFCSLKRQSFRDFEWIIIDDGSTDDTEDLVKSFHSENPFFQINYQKVPNGGKHRANNLAVRLSQGEMITCVDSDDYLTDTALEIIDKVEKSIPREVKQQFAGVCGQKGSGAGIPLKQSFVSSEYSDLTYLERLQKNIWSDCAEVFYRDVWLQYPYKEFAGENFLTEATALFEMAADGLKMRFFGQVIKVTEYLPDGLTENSRERFVNNPKGWGLYIYQRIKYGLLRGFGKWEVITDYYMVSRQRMTTKEIAKALHMSLIALYTRVMGVRLIYKLYKKPIQNKLKKE